MYHERDRLERMLGHLNINRIVATRYYKLICPLQSGPKVNLDWTLKETEHGQEARA